MVAAQLERETGEEVLRDVRTVTSTVKLEIRVAPVTVTDAFIGAANAFLEGVRVMSAAASIPASALTIVAGHSIECALKAFLAKVGVTEKQLSKRPFAHDILSLWGESSKRGLPLPIPTPDWVGQLARVYDSPYVARYPLGIHGIVLPNMIALSGGAEDVVRIVRAAIN